MTYDHRSRLKHRKISPLDLLPPAMSVASKSNRHSVSKREDSAHGCE